MASGQDLRFGYIDIAVTDERIIALFSGRSRAERPGRANVGNILYIYDWKARLHDVYKLDSDVIAIAVRDSILYALRHDPRPAVLRYVLKNP